MQIGGSSSLQAAEFGGKYRGGFSRGPFEIDQPELSRTRLGPYVKRRKDEGFSP